MMIVRNLSRDRAWLLFILIAGLLLRLYRLGFQSFWLDELHTAIEADPKLSWAELSAYLRCCDQHPPLFFILEKGLFAIFGDTEAVARILPALAGTISIWVVYLLGKEFYSRTLGCIAATLTCVNYFHIHYSQEARPYALLFLFGALSFLYLARLIKSPAPRTSILYCLFTVLMLFTHYFALFAVAAQAVIAFLFIVWEKHQRRQLIKYLIVSGLVVGICFAPWLSFLSSMASIRSFWIKPIPPGFALDYFSEYFGASDLLQPFVLLFLILALLRFFDKPNVPQSGIKADPYAFAFISCFLWISVTYLLPYLRSILVIPMLQARYTIVVLPAFFIVLAFGLEGIANTRVRYTLLTFFCLLSLIDLGVVKRAYTSPQKSQFREMAKYIAADSASNLPVVGGATAWHQRYYLRKYGFTSAIVEGPAETAIDSILNREGSYAGITGFWLTDGSGGEKPSEALRARIASSFILLREQDLYGAWLQLYVSKQTAAQRSVALDYRHFPGNVFNLNNDTVIAIWDRTPAVTQMRLGEGEYSADVWMSGTPVQGVFPHMNILINDRNVHSFFTQRDFTHQRFSFRNERDTIATLKIIMDNDAKSSNPEQDRNAFVKSISILKLE